MATTTSTALSMKLLVDTKAGRVLFAEASKDVVDFLFSLLALPLATAVRLLGKDSMVGCVGSLYASVDGLDATYYVQPAAAAAKDALLRPAMLSPAAASSLLLDYLPDPPSFPAKTFYRCNTQCSSGAPVPVPAFGTPPAGFRFGGSGSGSGVASCKSCRGYMTDTAGTACPSCGTQMTTALQFVAGGGDNDEGFVRGMVTYTVMDDLKVTPMSAISGITLLLSTFGVTDLSALQEKTVQIGYNEGLEILKASLQSKTVLTDVFLANKPPACTGTNA